MLLIKKSQWPSCFLKGEVVASKLVAAASIALPTATEGMGKSDLVARALVTRTAGTPIRPADDVCSLYGVIAQCATAHECAGSLESRFLDLPSQCQELYLPV
jgi:hypothetical protein